MPRSPGVFVAQPWSFRRVGLEFSPRRAWWQAVSAGAEFALWGWHNATPTVFFADFSAQKARNACGIAE